VSIGYTPERKMQKQISVETWEPFLRWKALRNMNGKFNILKDINKKTGWDIQPVSVAICGVVEFL
jgi:hypothetical protein